MHFVRITAVCALLLLATGAVSQAQHRHSISADPIGLAFGVLNATYEQATGPANTFTIFGSYWSYSDWTAFGFGGSYRWYFDVGEGKNPIRGLSAGPMISVGFWDYGGNVLFGSYDGGTSIAIGGELAYKWVFGQFVVEPILRLGFGLNKIEGLNYRAVGLGVNLGYAW